MSKIYVVSGSTGEYSDRSEWLVRAFRDKGYAEDHVLRCEEQGRLLMLALKSGTVDRYDEIPEEYLKYDLNMECDYTGVSYYVDEVELDE